jgi:hypothetical protein
MQCKITQMYPSDDEFIRSKHELQIIFNVKNEAHGNVVVKALGYKPEGRGFETRWGEILNLPNPSGHTRPWGSLSFWQKWVPETLK